MQKTHRKHSVFFREVFKYEPSRHKGSCFGVSCRTRFSFENHSKS